MEAPQRKRKKANQKANKMLEAIISTMMLIIGICVFIQKTRARTIVAFIFAFMLLSHNMYFHSLSSNLDMYYISAGILDLLVILFISAMKDSPRLAGDIQNISLISIMFNGLGWLLFVGGQSATAYIALYSLLYGWAIITLIRGEPENDGYFEVDTRLFAFHRNICHRRMVNNGKQK